MWILPTDEGVSTWSRLNSVTSIKNINILLVAKCNL